jgi:probable rRNA maturation factor
MKLAIINNTEYKVLPNFLETTLQISIEEIQKSTMSFAKAIQSEKLSINIIFCSNTEIQEINKTWRNKDQVTDVLSFPSFEKEEIQTDNFNTHETCFGEIFISPEQIKLQAEYLKHSIKKELSILVTHGILHLFQFNHIQDKDFLIMNSLEKTIEKRLNKELLNRDYT